MKRYRAELFSRPLGLWIEHWRSCETQEEAQEVCDLYTTNQGYIYPKARVVEIETKQ